MLTIGLPIFLTSTRDICRLDDGFGRRILDNYLLMDLRTTPEDLLFLLTGSEEEPEEQPDTGNSLWQSRIDTNMQVEIVNNLINRIVNQDNDYFSYQDTIFVQAVLRKFGLTGEREFLTQVRELHQQVEKLENITHYYPEPEAPATTASFPAPDEPLPGERPPAAVAGEETPALLQARLYLHDEIFRRLATWALYDSLQIYTQNLSLSDYFINRQEMRVAHSIFPLKYYLQQDSPAVRNLLAQEFVQSDFTFYAAVADQVEPQDDGAVNLEFITAKAFYDTMAGVFFSRQEQMFNRRQVNYRLEQSLRAVANYVAAEYKTWRAERRDFLTVVSPGMLSRVYNSLWEYGEYQDSYVLQEEIWRLRQELVNMFPSPAANAPPLLLEEVNINQQQFLRREIQKLTGQPPEPFPEARILQETGRAAAELPPESLELIYREEEAAAADPGPEAAAPGAAEVPRREEPGATVSERLATAETILETVLEQWEKSEDTPPAAGPPERPADTPPERAYRPPGEPAGRPVAETAPEKPELIYREQATEAGDTDPEAAAVVGGEILRQELRQETERLLAAAATPETVPKQRERSGAAPPAAEPVERPADTPPESAYQPPGESVGRPAKEISPESPELIHQEPATAAADSEPETAAAGGEILRQELRRETERLKTLETMRETVLEQWERSGTAPPEAGAPVSRPDGSAPALAYEAPEDEAVRSAENLPLYRQDSPDPEYITLPAGVEPPGEEDVSNPPAAVVPAADAPPRLEKITATRTEMVLPGSPEAPADREYIPELLQEAAAAEAVAGQRPPTATEIQILESKRLSQTLEQIWKLKEKESLTATETSQSSTATFTETEALHSELLRESTEQERERLEREQSFLRETDTRELEATWRQELILPPAAAIPPVRPGPPGAAGPSGRNPVAPTTGESPTSREREIIYPPPGREPGGEAAAGSVPEALNQQIMTLLTQYNENPEEMIRTGKVKPGASEDLLRELTWFNNGVEVAVETEIPALRAAVDRGLRVREERETLPALVHRVLREEREEDEEVRRRRSGTQVRTEEVREAVHHQTVHAVNNVETRITEETKENVTNLVDKVINSQLGLLSDKVYQQIEKRLRTERARRGT